MKRIFVVALLTVFLAGITGLLTTADTVEMYDDQKEIVKFFNSVDDDNYDGLDLSDVDARDFEKVVVVTPEGIDDGTYEVKNGDSNGKVLVIVDPIHVTE